MLLFISIFATLFVLTNDPTLTLGSNIYIGFEAILLVLFFTAPALIGIANIYPLIPQAILGLGLGVFWIFLASTRSIFSLGVPNVTAAIGITGTIIIKVLIAPIVEEYAFRGLARNVLQTYFKLNPTISNAVQAAMFSLFHINVFGGFFLNNGNFIGAFLFGMAAGLLSQVRFAGGSEYNLFPGMASHAIFNTWAIRNTLTIIG